jgi:hypothetical protein
MLGVGLPDIHTTQVVEPMAMLSQHDGSLQTLTGQLLRCSIAIVTKVVTSHTTRVTFNFNQVICYFVLLPVEGSNLVTQHGGFRF